MTDITFYYGVENNYTNITDIVLESCLSDKIITIPNTDLAIRFRMCLNIFLLLQMEVLQSMNTLKQLK